jgi:hypothetical protein
MALGTAFRAFFAALFDRQQAERIRVVLEQPSAETAALPPPEKDGKIPTAAPSAPPGPARSEAITLLATLQRETRLVDLVKEPLEGFSDAQIGAAARPCLQQCARTLDRLFGIHPATEEPEGALSEVPESASPTRYQWVGEGTASQGRVVHHGWEAARCELPQWTGPAEDTRMIAPIQLEK